MQTSQAPAQAIEQTIHVNTTKNDLYLVTYEVRNGEAGYIIHHAARAKNITGAWTKARRYGRSFYLEDSESNKDYRDCWQRKDGSEYIRLESVQLTDVAGLIQAILI